MSISATCPGCHQRLTLADHLLGKRVRCPRCQQAFSVEEHELRAVEEHSPARAVEGEPRRRRRRVPRRKSNRPLLLLGLSAGVVVTAAFLLGTGLWLWHRFSSDASNSQQKVVGGPSLFDKDGKARKDIPGFAGIQGGMQDDRPHRLKMPKYGFTFTTPNNRWRILTSPVAQPPKNLALSMCAGDEMYGLPRAISGTYSLPELTLLVNDHDGSPIETISQQAKMEIAAELQDWRLLDEKLMTINSKKAYRLASSAVLPAGGQSEEVHLLQFYYIGPKSKVFILTFSASPHSFADYRERFEMSGESVEIE